MAILQGLGAIGMFNYGEAFSRNIGWVTDDEQEQLRRKRVAIAGLGGVGGSHLLTLTRLGIGAFNISDLDEFELLTEANCATIGDITYNAVF